MEKPQRLAHYSTEGDSDKPFKCYRIRYREYFLKNKKAAVRQKALFLPNKNKRY